MPTSLADYIVIHDTAIELGTHTAVGHPAGDSRSFPIEVPEDIVESTGSKRPFLTFFVDPSSDAPRTRLSVSFYRPSLVTDRYANIFTYSYRGGVGRSHIEVFPTHLLTRYSPVSLSLTRVVDPDDADTQRGILYVSDIVLWFQRSIDV
jgi:hypothetical protein